MLNLSIIFIWLLTPILIFKDSKILPYLLFGSLSISIFDNPFNVNISYFFYFGFSYFFIKLFTRIIILNIFFIYFIFYNTFITLFFYSIYFYETNANFSLIFYTYLVSQFKIISLFGIYYYLNDIKLSLINFNYYFLTPLLLSTLFGYLIFIGFDSPYYFFKNFGYTTNESSNFNIIRLSGLTQEPRYLAYLIVFGLFITFFSSTSSSIKNYFLNFFLIFSLYLTKSLSGFMLFIFALSLRLFKNFSLLRTLFIIFIFFIFISYLLFTNNNFLFLLEQRISNRNIVNFNYLPSVFSFFEHHDLVALYFLENNFLVTLFGIGYGQIKNYEGLYGVFIDPTMTLFNLNNSIHCCDPQSLLINFISSFGIINTFVILILYLRNVGLNNFFIGFILFNLFNLPPGPLPFFIMIFALLFTSNNSKFYFSTKF